MLGLGPVTHTTPSSSSGLMLEQWMSPHGQGEGLALLTCPGSGSPGLWPEWGVGPFETQIKSGMGLQVVRTLPLPYSKSPWKFGSWELRSAHSLGTKGQLAAAEMLPVGVTLFLPVSLIGLLLRPGHTQSRNFSGPPLCLRLTPL